MQDHWAGFQCIHREVEELYRATAGEEATHYRVGCRGEAVTFLNIVDPTGAVITHVVDVNPRKASRVIGGSGQQIVGPSALTELRPEVVVLMNPIYREEIASTLQALGLHPELLVA